MDFLGLDIAKLTFDALLITQTGKHHASFPNTQAGFDQAETWIARHRTPDRTLHACMEATGNWGLDLAAFLHAAAYTVSIVNPKQIKAFGEAELSRNKTDKLDAGLIARFCRAQNPPPWTPPLAHMRELRELTRRCASLKAQRTQEINRLKAGLHSQTVHASILRSQRAIETEIETMTGAIRTLLATDPALQRNFDLLVTIPGIGQVTAALLLAELPNIAEFNPKGLAAFAGLSPAEHSSGARRHSAGISRIGNAAIRSALYLAALSARRYNPRLTDFATRLKNAGKPNQVILIAVARKLLVMAHAVIRTQQSFQPEPPPAAATA